MVTNKLILISIVRFSDTDRLSSRSKNILGYTQSESPPYDLETTYMSLWTVQSSEDAKLTASISLRNRMIKKQVQVNSMGSHMRPPRQTHGPCVFSTVVISIVATFRRKYIHKYISMYVLYFADDARSHVGRLCAFSYITAT